MKYFKIIGLFAFLFLFSNNIFSQEYAKLVKQADDAYQLQEYTRSANAYDKAFKVQEKISAGDYYNAACSNSLAGNKEIALAYLKNSVENGWTSLDWMQKDKDLEGLHNEKKYQKIVKKLTKLRKGIEKDWNRPLMEELAEIQNKDQLYRKEMNVVSEKYGWNSPEMTELWDKQSLLDSLNQKRIAEIIEQYGYPGTSLVGNQAGAAFLVIQHADLAMQEKYLPLMKEAADKKELRWSSLALLIDRINMRNGKPQIYGSQLTRNEETGGWEFYDIEDEKNVNKRREEVGLGKLEEYAVRFGLEYSVPEN